MPYFAVINEGTYAEKATVGLATVGEIESVVDRMVENGRYSPLADEIITVTIFDMRIDPKTLTRDVVRAYFFDFQDAKGKPEKIDATESRLKYEEEGAD